MRHKSERYRASDEVEPVAEDLGQIARKGRQVTNELWDALNKHEKLTRLQQWINDHSTLPTMAPLWQPIYKTVAQIQNIREWINNHA